MARRGKKKLKTTPISRTKLLFNSEERGETA